MKNIFKHKTIIVALIALSTYFQSCSLDEYNPSGFEIPQTATTIRGYETLINQCYFSIQRYFYATENWMHITEGGTDLWTYQANKSNTWTQWFWYFAGSSPNTTYTNNWWNGTYDGIGACNIAIDLKDVPPFKTEEERNQVVAEAYFLRAVYYFNAVEQFGSVTKVLVPSTDINYHPERTDPLTIYNEVILPELEFAFKWLPVGDHKTTTRATKKAALGFLAKAYLQATAHDPSKKHAAKALEYANMLIADADAGGAQYNAYMYPTFEEVFKESNNWENKEALWKHRWYADNEGSGSSNGNHKLNRNNEYFYCNVTNFGARVDDQNTRLTWGGNPSGQFMPTQHLLSLFVQEDNTLDPRFKQSFQTEWNANNKYSWDKTTVAKYDRASSVEGTTLNIGDLAIKFIMPQDANYAADVANKLTQPYLVVDYKDIYNDAKKNINMKYVYQNPTEGYPSNGTAENLFNYFYPSLSKHNSSNYHVANASKKRNGNLNATFIMRMAEVYLIAAEADLYANGGGASLGYLNKVRERAGAKPLSGSITIETILDERARELCGESTRFYDLKRTGKLKDDQYLKKNHPDLAEFFQPEYALRPIPTNFTEVLENGGAYYQNPGY